MRFSAAAYPTQDQRNKPGKRMRIQIESHIELGEKIPTFDQQAVKNEPMLFSCSFWSAHMLGGPITRTFLDTLPVEWKTDKTIVDSRVHMLMPGWYPCIPGYHHDDVPRERSDGQPDYIAPSYRPKHAMLLVNADICPTEFAIGNGTFSEVPKGEIIYKQWHLEVKAKLEAGQLTKFECPDRQIVFFDDRTWHQGTRARKNGWRFFIRATMDTGRVATNEIRRQVQVYLENPMEGW